MPPPPRAGDPVPPPTARDPGQPGRSPHPRPRAAASSSCGHEERLGLVQPPGAHQRVARRGPATARTPARPRPGPTVIATTGSRARSTASWSPRAAATWASGQPGGDHHQLVVARLRRRRPRVLLRRDPLAAGRRHQSPPRTAPAAATTRGRTPPATTRRAPRPPPPRPRRPAANPARANHTYDHTAIRIDAGRSAAGAVRASDAVRAHDVVAPPGAASRRAMLDALQRRTGLAVGEPSRTRSYVARPSGSCPCQPRPSPSSASASTRTGSPGRGQLDAPGCAQLHHLAAPQPPDGVQGPPLRHHRAHEASSASSACGPRLRGAGARPRRGARAGWRGSPDAASRNGPGANAATSRAKASAWIRSPAPIIASTARNSRCSAARRSGLSLLPSTSAHAAWPRHRRSPAGARRRPARASSAFGRGRRP